MVNRQAATASEETDPCASRMNVDAVETATIPMPSTRAGGTGGALGLGREDGDSVAIALS